MTLILGIDAAWTPRNVSGVALVRQTAAGKWEAVAIDDNYEGFIRRAGILTKPNEGVSPSDLLKAAKALGCCEVSLVAADIPLSKLAISGRRYSDDEVSSAYGSRGCSTHSPSAARPGPISDQMRAGFEECGYRLATNDGMGLAPKALIETYPHPALLHLLGEHYRVPYKVDRSRNYYPNSTPEARREKILEKLREIHAGLSRVISGVTIDFPGSQPSRAILKSIEDRIDALVCAWVGIRALAGKALAMGDSNSAIWLPSDWCAFFLSEMRASEDVMKNVEDLPVQERAFWKDA